MRIAAALNIGFLEMRMHFFLTVFPEAFFFTPRRLLVRGLIPPTVGHFFKFSSKKLHLPRVILFSAYH